MRALALAPAGDLEAAWATLPQRPDWAHLRRPEIGMTMVRGRAGGVGQRFNLGEMTVTRCAVRLADGRVGFGHVAGRDKRHAELAALLDAVLQAPGTQAGLIARIVVPIEAAIDAARRDRREKAAATRVQFFTMVRGE
ncbi:MAG: phosphonate C-P lyase system protein PhnG [Alphaproteobacteria bacterium]